MPSTAIRRYDYDAARRELHISYVGGGDYVYLGVPPEEAEALKATRAKGNYVNEVIKRHPFRRDAAPEKRAREA
jgi:hypothetical protein